MCPHTFNVTLILELAELTSWEKSPIKRLHSTSQHVDPSIMKLEREEHFDYKGLVNLKNVITREDHFMLNAFTWAGAFSS
jgi:hypothetical protein